MAWLVVEGHCVISPFTRALSAAISGEDHPALRAALSDEPQSVRVLDPQFALALAGRTLPLGEVMAFHTHVVAEDGPTALAALDMGQAEGDAWRCAPSTVTATGCVCETSTFTSRWRPSRSVCPDPPSRGRSGWSSGPRRGPHSACPYHGGALDEARRAAPWRPVEKPMPASASCGSHAG
ncbi:hypothetical protein PV392_05140 [Streptomyces sp. ME03-5709C]|nr:hypothetical protein [Streptomyces sp. ME03-5709C]